MWCSPGKKIVMCSALQRCAMHSSSRLSILSVCSESCAEAGMAGHGSAWRVRLLDDGDPDRLSGKSYKPSLALGCVLKSFVGVMGRVGHMLAHDV